MGQLIPFSETKQLPAHIQKFLAEQGANIDPRTNVPQLSFRGKVWRTVINGEETTLMKDDEPISTIHVVVLAHNKARSRAYYEGAFEEGKSQAPVCWATDGEVPDETVKQKQAATCAKCKWSVKGSKITPNGKEVTACGTFKRAAVAPLTDLVNPPEGGVRKLLLKIPQTSMWDKKNEENESKGFYAWDQYLDMLRSRGAMHTGLVATKMRFDSRTAYPKLLFAASRWLVDEEIEAATPLFKDAEVEALLKAPEATVAARVTDKGPGDDDDDDDGDDNDAKTLTQKAVQKASGKAKAQGEIFDDDEAAPPPSKKQKAAAVAADEEDAPPPAKSKAAKKAAAPVAEDDDDEAPPPPPKKAKAAAAPPPDDDDEDAPPPPPKKAKAAAAPPPDDDDDEDAPPPPKAKAKKAAPPADDDDEAETVAPAGKKAAKAGAGLEDLLDDWEKP
jgi:hypothetical protein